MDKKTLIKHDEAYKIVEKIVKKYGEDALIPLKELAKKVGFHWGEEMKTEAGIQKVIDAATKLYEQLEAQEK